MNTTKPSAGAVRAAKAILDRDVRQDGPDLDEALARIIDAESGLAELLEAAKALHRDCTASDFNEHWDSYKAAQVAIAKVTNFNATAQQAAPMGRWNRQKRHSMNWQAKLRLENAQLRECLRELVEASLGAQCDCSPKERDSGHKSECWFPALREAIAKASDKKGTV